MAWAHGRLDVEQAEDEEYKRGERMQTVRVGQMTRRLRARRAFHAALSGRLRRGSRRAEAAARGMSASTRIGAGKRTAARVTVVSESKEDGEARGVFVMRGVGSPAASEPGISPGERILRDQFFSVRQSIRKSNTIRPNSRVRRD